MGLRVRWLLLAGAVVAGGILGGLPPGPLTAPPAWADAPAEEAAFVGRINDLRAGQGLGPLAVNARLTDGSCAWTHYMVSNGGISHDPDLASAAIAADPNWQKVGENVGRGYDVGTLFDAFVASPGHYRNLVDGDFNQVGVCVVFDGSTMYTTHRFLSVPTEPPPTEPPPTQPPPTEPPPTEPPPTQPPPTEPPPTQPPATPAPTTGTATTGPATTGPATTGPATTGTATTGTATTTTATTASGPATSGGATTTTATTTPGSTTSATSPPATLAAVRPADPAAPGSSLRCQIAALTRLDPR